MTSQIVVVEGSLVTVEEILLRSWLIRGRMDDKSLTSRYGWVTNLVETADRTCEFKGYLSRDRAMTPEEFAIVHRLGQRLGFEKGSYERRASDGNLRKRKILR